MFEGAELLEKIRREKPLVHHITNFVTIGDCADITLSLGALPVMAHAAEEVGEMAASASSIVLNTGTPSPARLEAMLKAGETAQKKGIPVVLDPAGAGATPFRTQIVQRIIERTAPPIIKGNGAEIGFLAGLRDVKISGVQSIDSGTDPLHNARRLLTLLRYRAVVAVTGAVDLITDGERVARVFNGHNLLPAVVGSGCMTASLAAAFAAVEKDYFLAATAALALMGVAGEIAAAHCEENCPCSGPATFKIRLLDAIFHLTPQEFSRRARIEI